MEYSTFSPPRPPKNTRPRDTPQRRRKGPAVRPAEVSFCRRWDLTPAANFFPFPLPRPAKSCARTLPNELECIGTSEHNRIAHFVLFHQIVELSLCLLDPVATVTDDNVDQTVPTMVEMTSQGADLVLTSDAPHGENQILVLHGLHVETDRCVGHHLEEDRGLSSCLKPNHQGPHLNLASPTTCAPEPCALVASTDIKTIFVDVHTTCYVKALLVDSQ